jgi:hypothetical protein
MATTSDRAQRIQRIRELQDERRHPERRVGLFSPTNLTRVVLRFGAMGLAAGLVRWLTGGGFLEVPLTGVAVGAADHGVGLLWGRIGGAVRQAWLILGVAAATLVLLVGVAPRSGFSRSLTGWGRDWLEARNASLDRRVASRRIPIDSEAASGRSWRLIVDSGSARLGTLAEARAWCSALGPGWQLPPFLGQWPELEPWPDFGTTFYVWSQGGAGIQIGDGRKPGAAVSGSGRPSEAHAVLCLEAPPR